MAAVWRASAFNAPSSNRENATMPDLATVRVLIVDDTTTSREEVKRGLDNLGYATFDVESAATFAEAKRTLESRPPDYFDLILCDYNLDGKATGVHVFEIALERRSEAHFAIYSSQDRIEVPIHEAY